MLDNVELAFAMDVARKVPAGLYAVRQLFGEHWEGNRRPRAYGRWFKAAVRAGQLPGVVWVGQKSNRAQLYEVRQPEAAVPVASSS